MLIKPEPPRDLSHVEFARPPKRRRSLWLLLGVPLVALATVLGSLLSATHAPTPPTPQVFDLYTQRNISASALYAAHCSAGNPIVVKSGDTLKSIAQKLGVTPAALAQENGMSASDSLVAGELLCPPSGVARTTINSGGNGEPCQSTVYWLPVISQWAIPPGCYANIYKPDPRNYPSRPAYGWCNWWPEVMHPELQGDQALHLPRHATPIPGATVWFDPYEQGAGSAGHYAIVIAVHPAGYWVLIAEMNNEWRGAGFAKVDYRYIHVSSHVWFLYNG